MKKGLVISHNEDLSSVIVELLALDEVLIEQFSSPYSNGVKVEDYHFIILDYYSSIMMEEFLYTQKKNSNLIVLHSSKHINSFKGNYQYHLVDKNIEAFSKISSMLSILLNQKSLPEYVPVNINFFLKYKYLGISAFLKMNDEKFIRILDSEIEQDQKFLSELKEKNVFSLYIKYKQASVFFQNILEKIYQNREKAMNAYKINQECLEHVHNKLKSLGINENDLSFAKEVFENSFRNLERLNLFLELKQMMSTRFFTYKLATMVSHISLIISKKHFQGIFFEKDDILWASLFQDISLNENDFCEISSIDELEQLDLTERLYKYVIDHPKESAELLSQNEEFFSNEVLKMIQTHHERPQGKGFPGLAELSSLSIPQKIQIISNDFCYEVLKTEDEELNADQIIQNLRGRYDIKGFGKIIDKIEIAFKS